MNRKAGQMNTLNDIDIRRIRTRDTDLESNEDSRSICADAGHDGNTRKKRTPYSRIESEESSGCSKCVCFVRIVCFLCLLGAILELVSLFLTGSPNPLKLLDWSDHEILREIQEEWETDGNGLNLVIENALDTDWAPYLEEYVTKWDKGVPDSLNLTMSQVDVDKECHPSLGRMKVCNGNYGETEWEGINLVLVKDGHIKWSTCKMNDYYLNNGSEAKKKYSMCHEIGHGLGLAHTDENYSNINRGDCMDYTHNPEGNLSPGKVNHEILARSYGTIPSKRMLRWKYDTSEDILKQCTQATQELELLRNCDKSVCMRDLGEGCVAFAHKLLVVPS